MTAASALRFAPDLLRREEFGALGDRIYLDICARSPLPRSAVAAITGYFNVCAEEGARKDEWLQHLTTVRKSMAALIGASPGEIAFVKATSEGVNAFAHSLRLSPGDNVAICPEVEHPNNVYPWLHLRRWGIQVRFVEAEDGQITARKVARIVDAKTRVVVAPHVSFRTGARADLRALADIAHATGAKLFVDAAQSLGLLDLNVEDAAVDAMAACVHKGLMAPYGMGILFCRRDLVASLIPVYVSRSGIDVEDPREYAIGDLDNVRLVETAQRFEYGSYNFPAIYGLGASLALLHSWKVDAVERHLMSLSLRLTSLLRDAAFKVVSPIDDGSRSHIVCIQHSNAESLARALDVRNIRVSARLGALRVAAAPFTTEAEIDQFVEVLNEITRGKSGTIRTHVAVEPTDCVKHAET